MKEQTRRLIDLIWNTVCGDTELSKEVMVLLLCGADPNACVENGEPLLHVAAFRGFILTAYALISRGADVNVQDPNGNTALMAAVIRRDENMVRLLLEAGADKTIMNNEHCSPMSIACGSIHKLMKKWDPETSKRIFIQIDEQETAAKIDRNPGLPRTYVEKKSRNWYIFWALLFPGVHNLYAGYKTRGVIQIICMLSIAGIYVAWPWAFVEAIVIRRDGEGNTMKEGSFLKVFLLWLLSTCALGICLAALSNKDTNDATEPASSIRVE